VEETSKRVELSEKKLRTRIQSAKRSSEVKQMAKRFRTILAGLDKGAISLKPSLSGRIQTLYKEGLGHFKQPESIKIEQQTAD